MLILSTLPQPGDTRSLVKNAVADLINRLCPALEDAFELRALGHPDPLFDVAMRHGADRLEWALHRLAAAVRSGATPPVQSWGGAARRLETILANGKLEIRS